MGRSNIMKCLIGGLLKWQSISSKSCIFTWEINDEVLIDKVEELTSGRYLGIRLKLMWEAQELSQDRTRDLQLALPTLLHPPFPCLTLIHWNSLCSSSGYNINVKIWHRLFTVPVRAVKSESLDICPLSSFLLLEVEALTRSFTRVQPPDLHTRAKQMQWWLS
jgi:hypothetical protein